MRRDTAKLADAEFDLLVIGGGIYGLCSAWDAAQRGLKVALVERGDFCGATSSNSLKIVHGGLRYLQNLDFPRMRLAISERRTMQRIAPHLVEPLGCVMPVHRGGPFTRGRIALRTAMAINDLISAGRNRGLSEAQRLPHGRLISPREFRDHFPLAPAESLTGAAIWYDARMQNTERLALCFLHAAVDSGAQAANYLEVTNLLREDAASPGARACASRVIGARVREVSSGEEFDVRAKLVLNTCGAWTDALLQDAGETPGDPVPQSVALNLVLKKPLVGEWALAIGERTLFFVGWRGRTLAGTAHFPLPHPLQPPVDGFPVTPEHVDTFLAEINRTYPAAAVTRDDVALVHGGLLPTEPEASTANGVTILRHHRVADHARSGGPEGLVSVHGVKWTTARAVAEQTIDLVSKKLGTPTADCRTAETVVPHGPDPLRYEDVAPGLLPGDSGVRGCDVVCAVRDEMARTLSDVVFRRTPLASAGDPGAAALQRCAVLVATELNWSPERVQEELAAVHKRLRAGLE